MSAEHPFGGASPPRASQEFRIQNLELRIMKEGEPRKTGFKESVKKWGIRGGIVAGILGIIALLASS